MADYSASVALLEGHNIASAKFARQGERIITEAIVVGKATKNFDNAPVAIVRKSLGYMLVQVVIQESDVENVATLQTTGEAAISGPRLALDVTANGNIPWQDLYDNDYITVIAPSLDFDGLSGGSRRLVNTNYFTNPRMQANVTDGWTLYGSPTVSRSTLVTPLGFAASMKIVADGGDDGRVARSVSNTAAELVTVSFLAYKDGTAITATDVDVIIKGNYASRNAVATLVITDVGLTYGKGWYRVSASRSTVGANDLHGIFVANGSTIYATAFQSEANGLSDYFDGASGTGYAWTGTADNSSSTYSAAEGLKALIVGRKPDEEKGLMRLVLETY